jgi:hypothetical protein
MRPKKKEIDYTRPLIRYCFTIGIGIAKITTGLLSVMMAEIEKYKAMFNAIRLLYKTNISKR